MTADGIAFFRRVIHRAVYAASMFSDGIPVRLMIGKTLSYYRPCLSSVTLKTS